MDGKEDLYGKTFREISEIVTKLNLPVYTTGQITDWLYKKKISTIEEMSNLPKAARQQLGALYYNGLSGPSKYQVSTDGTRKYLFQVRNGKYIEAVFIPESDRNTICLSSQIGCKMGCVFCMTARQGFQGNLSAGEILNQIVSLPENALLTNYVFMGMGEPLANTENVLKTLEIMTASWGFGLSPSRITVSTIGILPGLEHILDKSRCHIAVSLHTPFDSERQEMMPIQKIFPVKRVIDLLREKSSDRQRRLSFEYIMFKGLNDTAKHINGLTRLLNGLRCRINLIRYHPIPGASFESSDEETIQWFKNRLNEKGILTTVRASRGKDIFAACGMLSTKVQAET
ncbi:MAG TPA: 23S rRNA (adenine(2503)-C(2))-methyltransferase RlmN [Bacteroidales bacterium]|jgi:23S rRNA (adenine2503-C2)-methyltransferase|nr:23S rRNA (adenine(2503)-C(2))-methyltransferase RlmN [Bacteroidales bacterium]